VLESLGAGRVKYAGRAESAIPAPGIAKAYRAEQQSVLDAAFVGL
jgi:2-oxoglutarate dehydrogenase complex dehydrogenase (E1) component-like enzyme